MKLWAYVQEHDFSSPENQIKLLVAETQKIWSQGGPSLVIFHAIELNLPELLRKFFLLLVPIFNKLDKRKSGDSVGWSLIAVKS